MALRGSAVRIRLAPFQGISMSTSKDFPRSTHEECRLVFGKTLKVVLIGSSYGKVNFKAQHLIPFGYVRYKKIVTAL